MPESSGKRLPHLFIIYKCGTIEIGCRPFDDLARRPWEEIYQHTLCQKQGGLRRVYATLGQLGTHLLHVTDVGSYKVEA